MDAFNNTYRTTLLLRAAVLAAIWWLLTDADAASWWIGVPAVLLAALSSIALLPAAPLSWFQVLKFLPFFVTHSLLGGVDVARRALHPGMPIAPDFIIYPLRLPAGLPQVFMANTISLLPGTLSAELDKNCLKLHVIDARQDFLPELEAVEQAIASMFGQTLAIPGRIVK